MKLRPLIVCALFSVGLVSLSFAQETLAPSDTTDSLAAAEKRYFDLEKANQQLNEIRELEEDLRAERSQLAIYRIEDLQSQFRLLSSIRVELDSLYQMYEAKDGDFAESPEIDLDYFTRRYEVGLRVYDRLSFFTTTYFTIEQKKKRLNSDFLELGNRITSRKQVIDAMYVTQKMDERYFAGRAQVTVKEKIQKKSIYKAGQIAYDDLLKKMNREQNMALKVGLAQDLVNFLDDLKTLGQKEDTKDTEKRLRKVKDVTTIVKILDEEAGSN